MDEGSWADLKVEGLERALLKLDELESRLESARMTLPDADLVRDEFRNGIALARHACHLGIARIEAGRVEVSQLKEEERAELAVELEPIITEFRRLWLIRNRPGGLDDSAGRFEALLAAYKN